MTALNATAKATLREAGFTQAEWIRIHGYEGKWTGDICGCPDNRCANGFHHYGEDDCGCLPVLLDRAVMWREAARDPNRVELAAPYGIWNWADVSTTGVLVSVSATSGPIGIPLVGSPGVEESRIRIEPRDGWSYAVTYDEGRIEVRLVKAPPIAAEDAPATATGASDG
jgi:hypothetical protein